MQEGHHQTNVVALYLILGENYIGFAFYVNCSQRILLFSLNVQYKF